MKIYIKSEPSISDFPQYFNDNIPNGTPFIVTIGSFYTKIGIKHIENVGAYIQLSHAQGYNEIWRNVGDGWIKIQSFG